MLLNVIQDLILAHTEGKEHFCLLLMCFHLFFFFLLDVKQSGELDGSHYADE